MKVTIDSREQETINRILDYYNSNKANYPNIEEIEVKELPTGDFKTNDNYFGNERKSTKDFISSLLGGKLKQQLYEFKNNINEFKKELNKIKESNDTVKRKFNNCTKCGRLRYPQGRKTHNLIIINRLCFRGILCRITVIMSTNITIYIKQLSEISNL